MTNRSLKILIFCSCSFLLLHPQGVRNHGMSSSRIYPQIIMTNERNTEHYKLRIELLALDIGIIEREINKELDNQ